MTVHDETVKLSKLEARQGESRGRVYRILAVSAALCVVGLVGVAAIG